MTNEAFLNFATPKFKCAINCLFGIIVNFKSCNKIGIYIYGESKNLK